MTRRTNLTTSRITVILKCGGDQFEISGTAEAGVSYQTMKMRAMQAFDLEWDVWTGKAWVSHHLYHVGSGDRYTLCHHAVVKTNAVVEVYKYKSRRLPIEDAV